MYQSFRIKFSRLGPVKYLGHLDMLRYFQKVVLRSCLPIRYSEGFNPHQIMSFAYPLGVSMETMGDYFDIDLVFDDSVSFSDSNRTMAYCRQMKDTMNDVMEEGIAIEGVSLVPAGELNAMASVYAADYSILCKSDKEITPAMINDFLMQPEIYVVKETKKSKKCGTTNEVNIKEGILAFSLASVYSADTYSLFASLRSGSEMNIKAQTLVQNFGEFCQANLEIMELRRLELYRMSHKKMVSLGDFSV
ncbi:MAG: TIGR03936 family radical SAM-associated protein [Lachnospiraceae bacterium]